MGTSPIIELETQSKRALNLKQLKFQEIASSSLQNETVDIHLQNNEEKEDVSNFLICSPHAYMYELLHRPEWKTDHLQSGNHNTNQNKYNQHQENENPFKEITSHTGSTYKLKKKKKENNEKKRNSCLR